MKILYCGTFNPFHDGHFYIYNALVSKFGEENVYLGVGINPDKKVDLERILFHLKPITRNIISYQGLTADVVKQHKFDFLARGIRNSTDLEHENQLAYWNKQLCDINTLFIMTPPELSMISSSSLRMMMEYKQDHILFNKMNVDSYYRWKEECSKFDVYFGRCCSGKSTYLRTVNNKQHGFEMDKLFWEFVNISQEDKTWFINMLKQTFYTKDDMFNNILMGAMKQFDWKKFLEYVIVDSETLHMHYGTSRVFVDFPAIGTVWHSIPTEIRYKMRLIKVSTSEENRAEFSKARQTNPKLIECSDHFYVDPPFWDEEIFIKKEIDK